jgi:hypothetical protein
MHSRIYASIRELPDPDPAQAMPRRPASDMGLSSVDARAFSPRLHLLASFISSPLLALGSFIPTSFVSSGQKWK